MASSKPLGWLDAPQDHTGQTRAPADGISNVLYPAANQDHLGNAVMQCNDAGVGTASGHGFEYHSVPPPMPNQPPPFHQQVGAPYNLGPTLAQLSPPQFNQSVGPNHSQVLHPSNTPNYYGPTPSYAHVRTQQQQPPPAPHLQSFAQQPSMPYPRANLPGTALMHAGNRVRPTALPKNAIMLLNEASQKHRLGTPLYTYLTMPADTAHTVSLDLCQHTFIGTGASRAAAKNVAAEKALGQLQALRRSAPVQSETQGPQPMPNEKDSVSVLNEVCQKRALTALYSFSATASEQWKGPSHTAKLGIGGRFFVASAPRKDVAKKLAARAALDYLRGPGTRPTAKPSPVATVSMQTPEPPVSAQEITALAQALPVANGEPPAAGAQSLEARALGRATEKQGEGQVPSTAEGVPAVGGLAALSSGPATRTEYASVAGTEQDPVSLLNKHATLQGRPLGITVQASATGSIATLVMDGQTFSAEGASKGEAKKRVADRVLLHLEAQKPGTLESLLTKGSKKRPQTLDWGTVTVGADEMGVGATATSGPTSKKRKVAPHEEWVEKGKGERKAFAYSLAAVVSSRYRKLAHTRDTQPRQRKIVAAIILERPSPTGKSLLSVVAIGTGRHTAPQPISGDNFLRDCRPEVLACRAFRRFLFIRLERELRGGHFEVQHPTREDKPVVGLAVKQEDGGLEKGGSVEEAIGGETSESDAYGDERALKKVKVETGAEDAKQEGPSHSGGERTGSGKPTKDGETKAVKFEPSEDIPAVKDDNGAPGTESLKAKPAGAQPVSEPEPGAKADDPGGEDEEAAIAEGAGGAVGEEALFCREEGRRQWRLRDDVKVHLWVSLPQGSDSTEDDAERRSRQDKIRRWGALGLQGAVLSHLLSPVYLSIISVNCAAGLYREAVELPEVADLPRPPFAVQQPTVVRAGCMLKWAFRVAPGAGMTEDAENWALGDEGLETVKAAEGRPEGGESRLCRRRMFEQFRRLQDASSRATSADGGCEAPRVPTFPDWEAAKKAAVQYREAKAALAGVLLQQKQGAGGPRLDDAVTSTEAAQIEGVTTNAGPQTSQAEDGQERP